MNISKNEQRVLHVLAQGGCIDFIRLPNGKIADITCYTRDGHVLETCSIKLFDRLKKRRFIKSTNANPYRVTREGLQAVRAQLDNR